MQSKLLFRGASVLCPLSSVLCSSHFRLSPFQFSAFEQECPNDDGKSERGLAPEIPASQRRDFSRLRDLRSTAAAFSPPDRFGNANSSSNTPGAAFCGRTFRRILTIRA